MALTKLSTDVIDLSDNTEALTIPKGTSNSTVDVEYLVVGGGGGGGGRAAGGGGAGGYLSNYGGTKLGVNFSNNLIVTIGAGGGGGGLSARGGSGSNSIFSIIDSNGGGGGGYYINVSGLSGGSGGGGGAGSTPGGGGGGATPSGQGFNGGTGQGVNQSAAGGGGGASEVGVSPSVSGVSADGGDGLQNNIDGLNLYYAGGGGGSANHTYNGAGGNGGGGTGGTNSIQAIAGTDGRGGGGGGGAYDNTGRAGGNGVVIIRYVTSNATLTIGGGLTHSSTTIGSETIVTFTAGSDNISFAGTGTGRPSSPTEGLMRENTTTGKMEFYDGSLWQEITDTASTYVSGLIPSANFNTVTYTGDGSSSRSITGTGFAPDFTWTKKRGTSTGNHLLQNTVNGAGTGKSLSSNSNTAAGNFDIYGYISSFDTDGVTYQAGSSGSYPDDNANESGSTYVSWNWKAGGAATTISGVGTVNSDVSANTAAGFSIVSFTNGASGTSTVAHGLGKIPEIIIMKQTNASTNWVVYNANGGAGRTLVFNGNNAYSADNASVQWGSVPTSTVFTVTNNSSLTNGSSPHIAYCWTSIPGYSKIGFYVGNGSATGPIVYTGFKPAWIMIKRTDISANWRILDNKRSPSNPRDKELYPNLSNAEGTYTAINFNSSGFQLINNDASYNAIGGTYIYMAFSE